jgi:hypothetical protein
VTLHTGIEFSLTGLEYACLLLDRDLGGLHKQSRILPIFPQLVYLSEAFLCVAVRGLLQVARADETKLSREW